MKPIVLEAIIGLETHVQLRTKSKMFCRCDNTGEDQQPNTTVCPICMGHPGTLPVPNGEAVRWATKAALALKCTVAGEFKFDRKSYFYPDLPKGYQISQYDQPIGTDGHMEINVDGRSVRIGIERIHLEEDTAKMLHGAATRIDFNRSGTPLVEIVTKPVVPSPTAAKIFLQDLRAIMRALDISDADMEKGHLRCDANISLRPVPENFQRAKKALGLDGDATSLFPKTEVKNLNSFRAVERALNHEIKRQTKLWHAGKPPLTPATRRWDEDSQTTHAMREKEAQHDYRYFPEPDIPPFRFASDEIERIAADIPELPAAKRGRFEQEYGMSAADAHLVTADNEIADFTEEVMSELKEWIVSVDGMEGTAEEIWHTNKKKLVKQVVSWITSRLFSLLNEHGISVKNSKISPENFAELITLIHQRRVNQSIAQTILTKMFGTGNDPSDILESEDLSQVGDGDELEGIIDGVIAAHPDMVAQYRAGKTVVIQFLIGQVMKKSKGKADPEAVKKLLEKSLAK